MPAPNKSICKSLAHGRSISCKSLLYYIRLDEMLPGS